MKKLTLLCFSLFLLSNVFGQYKVGIVFSGGGALGYSHVGVMQALEENGIKPNIIAGTSMGAIIGAFFASGYSASELYSIIEKEKFDNTFNVLHFGWERNRKKLGFSSHRNIEKVFERYLPHNFDSLAIPLYICVTNISTGQLEYVHSGNDLHEYLLGSSSIPAIFTPTIINDMYYIDGGVLNNFPSQAIRDQCDILIGIEINPSLKELKIKNTKDVASRTISVMLYHNTSPGYKLCDYLFTSSADEKYSTLDFKAFKEIYQYGYEAAVKIIKDNPDFIKRIHELMNQK